MAALSPFSRHRSEFQKLLDMNILAESFLKCKRGVDWKYSIQHFEENLLSNIYHLAEELRTGTYRQKSFYEFIIHERGKARRIKAMHIRDRVVQRALCDWILMPTLQRYLIYDNGANVKGKGTDFAKVRFKVHLRRFFINNGSSNEGYVLKIDFKKYFESIDHNTAIKLLEERIKDKRVMKLIEHYIDFCKEGVGIGSQLSQVIGTYFPCKIDNFITTVLGNKYYGRFADDSYIIHRDKQYLKDILNLVREKCKEFGITINEKKTYIQKLTKPVKFLKVKYILSKTGKVDMIPPKDTFKREREKLKKISRFRTNDILIEQYRSWRGTVTKTKYISYKSHHKIQRMDNYFNNIIRREAA